LPCIPRTITITAAAAHGSLFRNGVALALGGTFTQADINNGLISYTHDGSETTADSFGFTVSDGAGGEAPGTFVLAVTAVNDAPVNIVPGTQTIQANTSAAIVGLSIADVDAGAGTTIHTGTRPWLTRCAARSISTPDGSPLSLTRTATGTPTLPASPSS
jgi:hypothetical protein